MLAHLMRPPLLAAAVTPLRDGGNTLDDDAIAQLVAYLEAGGVDGVFCCDDLERPSDWLDWSTVRFVNHHTAHAAAARACSLTENGRKGVSRSRFCCS